MANRERGEMTLNAGGREYTLRLTTNACCAIEDRTGKTVEEWIKLWHDKHSITALRWCVWASLQDQHKTDVPTPEAAGDLLDSCDQETMTKLMASFFLMNTEERMKLIRAGLLAEAPLPKGRDADPQAAQTDAGGVSTSTPVH